MNFLLLYFFSYLFLVSTLKDHISIYTDQEIQDSSVMSLSINCVCNDIFSLKFPWTKKNTIN